MRAALTGAIKIPNTRARESYVPSEALDKLRVSSAKLPHAYGDPRRSAQSL